MTIRYGVWESRMPVSLIHVVDPFGLVGKRTSRSPDRIATTGKKSGEPCNVAAIAVADGPPGATNEGVVALNAAMRPTGLIVTGATGTATGGGFGGRRTAGAGGSFGVECSPNTTTPATTANVASDAAISRFRGGDPRDAPGLPARRRGVPEAGSSISAQPVTETVVVPIGLFGAVGTTAKVVVSPVGTPAFVRAVVDAAALAAA